MLKFHIVFGTRPELIKLFPIYKALLNKQVHVKLINTGQHKELMEPIIKLMNIKPDYDLEIMQQNQSLSGVSSRLLEKFQQLFLIDKPDYLIVQGDTTTAFIGALVGFYNQIKIAHIEAGLRTYDRDSPFPEEINRQLISVLSNYHFAPTKNSYQNLVKENRANIFLSGNTVIDCLNIFKEKIKSNSDYYEKKYSNIMNGKICLITIHRRENFGEKLMNICKAIAQLALLYPFAQFVFPVHLNPNVRNVVFNDLGKYENIHLIDPLSYDDLIYIISKSYLILTDSGGIQEEAPSFNVPVIVLRKNTERPEGVEAGCSVLVGTDPVNIMNHFSKLMDDSIAYQRMVNIENPYGDGNASKRIVEELLSEV